MLLAAFGELGTDVGLFAGAAFVARGGTGGLGVLHTWPTHGVQRGRHILAGGKQPLDQRAELFGGGAGLAQRGSSAASRRIRARASAVSGGGVITVGLIRVA
ncbi:hypothetical protein [Spongiactinospora sp. 9N601]|uniref:hypothetical protein n=1 Tax=Spongiactinospora sp. 9N601 TaxID=3375149 RepID=UPI00378C1A73